MEEKKINPEASFVNDFISMALDIGWTPYDLAKLSKDRTNAKLFLAILRGEAKVDYLEHIIDCTVNARLPDQAWKVDVHLDNGLLAWKQTKIELVLHPKQYGPIVKGIEIYNELKTLELLNSNVLDYLLDHPYLIPKLWEKDNQGNNRSIFFLGTIYRAKNDKRVVRYLQFTGCHWTENPFWIDDDWIGDNPIAVLI